MTRTLSAMRMMATALMLGFAVCSCQTFQDAWKEALAENSLTPKEGSTNKKVDDFFAPAVYEYIISFYPMPMNENSGMIISSIPDAGSREPVYLHRVPCVQARDIAEIKYVPSPVKKGFMRLHLRLTDKGRRRWAAMTGNYLNSPIAVVVDGEYHRTFVPKYATQGDETWVSMDVDFPPKLSRNLRKHASRNCKHFTKTPFNFFGGE